jgi:hypothetical protein
VIYLAIIPFLFVLTLSTLRAQSDVEHEEPIPFNNALLLNMRLPEDPAAVAKRNREKKSVRIFRSG